MARAVGDERRREEMVASGNWWRRGDAALSR